MKATPFSSRPYYPMMLANGSNAVLVDYAGSVFPSRNGHSHYEQHQGTPCGWYKVANRWQTPSKIIQSVVGCGYQVMVNDEICEPRNYEQSFDPRRAVLKTVITSFGGVELEIESLLNDDDVLVEHYDFLKVPVDYQVDFSVFVMRPYSGMVAVELRTPPVFTVVRDGTTGDNISFAYRIGAVEGRGEMWVDGGSPDPELQFTEEEGRVLFSRLSTGDRITRYLTVSDNTETEDYLGILKQRTSLYRERDWKTIRKEHGAVWEQYFTTSEVVFPDADTGYLYDLGRYMMRASSHPETGGLTVGMLPHLWGGGVYVPYDAWYMHQALLLTNNLKESGAHLDYYLAQYQQGREIAAAAGARGAAFSGWATCFGEHCSHRELKEYIKHYKPMMSGYIGIIFYWQWKYAGQLSAGHRRVLRDVLEFIREFVVEYDAFAEVVPCMAGNESDIEVKNDSHTALLFARVFRGAAEIFAESGYAELADKLYRGLNNNYEEYILMPFPGAWYLTGFQIWAFIMNLPEGINPGNVRILLEKMKTPWGYDGIQPSEVYRDWPWIAGRGAVCEAHLKQPASAFALLRHQHKYISSLGAIPEKIRLDGFPIGYWYSSPHALFLWSMIAALVHMGPKGELRIMWGMDGTWRDLSFRDLRMGGGILVSGAVRQGRLTALTVKNDTDKKITLTVAVNPVYGDPDMPEKVTIEGDDSWVWEMQNVES